MEEIYKFILYLDMDGVLTSSNYIIYIHDHLVDKDDEDKITYKYRNFMQQYCFQREAVDCLNKLYDKFPYCIILTTTRRFEFTSTEWNLIFRLNGIKAYVGGRTKSLAFDKNRYTWREDEIYDYHNAEGMFNFKNIPLIVIDDDSYDLQKYKDRLINVKTETGLTMDYYQEILDKLKAQGVK